MSKKESRYRTAIGIFPTRPIPKSHHITLETCVEQQQKAKVSRNYFRNNVHVCIWQIYSYATEST